MKKRLWMCAAVLLALTFSTPLFANSQVYLSEPQTIPPEQDLEYRQELVHKLGRTEGVETVEVGDNLKIILSVDHFFRHQNNSQIRLSRVPILEDITKLLRTYSTNRRIIVSGHTDNVGSDESKFFRSGQQAETIASYLWTNGISLSRMTILACGDTKPVSSNRILEGSAANRRIEIELGSDHRPRYYK